MLNKSQWIFILIYFFSALSWAQNLSVFGSLSSRYKDVAKESLETVTGSYYTVEYKNEKYVVTAAHVSQGDQGLVGKASEERLADLQSDLEIFKVSKDTPALAIYHQQLRSFIVPQESLAAIRSSLVLLSDEVFIPKGKWVLGQIQNWKQPRPFVSDSYSTSDADFSLVNSLFRGTGFNEVFVAHNILPGMSGSPLIANYPVCDGGGLCKKVFSVSGTALRYNRFFVGSTYSHAQALVVLLEKYLAGQRGVLGSSRWSMYQGLTFRRGGSLEEVVFCNKQPQAPAGGGTQGDGGGGTQGDGGGGTQGDGGGGTQGDGGGSKRSLPCMTYAVKYRQKAVFGFIDEFGDFNAPDFSKMSALGGQLDRLKLLSDADSEQLSWQVIKRLKNDSSGAPSSFCFVQSEKDQSHIRLRNIWDPQVRDFVQLPEVSLKHQFSQMNYFVTLKSPKSDTRYSIDLRGLVFDQYREFQSPNADKWFKQNKLSHIRIGLLTSPESSIVTKCSFDINWPR